MINALKEWYNALGRLGKRGLLYTLAGVAGLTAYLIRVGWQQPFGVVIWILIIGIGLYFLFFLAGRRS
ncbi:MAG TPA: hypothetical protein PLN61_06725 [bacterium]|nr:hypothetical protein [bacterium]HQI48344.1 hypothetical protein [bacterium]HQJ63446.1 hypothetical protein [bacterium]